MKRSWITSFAAVAAAMSLSACANMMAPPPPPPPPVAAVPVAPPPTASLYQRLGGQAAIVAVVKDFVENQVAPDPRINRFFAATVRANRVAQLEAAVVDQICQATGGPCVSKGPPMPVVHRGMRREFLGFNRARHAVLEAAILATRTHLLPADQIRAEFARLQVIVDKTAGPREREAMALLSEYVRTAREATPA